MSHNSDSRVHFGFQGDLHSYVRVRKRLREPEAKRLFRQMCEVVKSCHEQGIVLRDLKLRKFVFADTERWVLYCFFNKNNCIVWQQLFEIEYGVLISFITLFDIRTS